MSFPLVWNAVYSSLWCGLICLMLNMMFVQNARLVRTIALASFFYPHFGSLLALCQFQLRHRVLAKVNIDGRRMETQSAVKLETYFGVKAFSGDFRGNWGENGGRGLKRKCAPFLGVKVLFSKPTPISTPYPRKYPPNTLCSTKLRLFLKSGWML